MEKTNNRFFTSPLKKINYCSECDNPIKETDGRFHVEVQSDMYIDRMRFLSALGFKTYCSNCFEKLFGYDNWKDSESIYKRERGKANE